MTSRVVQLDDEKQGFRMSAMHQHRVAAILGNALLAAMVSRTPGARTEPIIDLDAVEIYWPNASEDDKWLRMLANCVPEDLEDPHVSRLDIDKIAQEFVKAAWPTKVHVPSVVGGRRL